MTAGRPVVLRRSWLFLPGADAKALRRAPESGADVLIQELEDFTPPARRPEARTLCPEIYAGWREAGRVAAVRINPLETDGIDDLAAAMPGRPDCVLMSKVVSAEQIRRLDALVTAHEEALGIATGTTEIVPNIESARGLVRTIEIATASPRVTAALVASEDMVADLGAERSREGHELAYVRARFLVECVAAEVVPIDCPYTYGDEPGAAADMEISRRIGFRAKSLVLPAQVALVNRALTPSPEAVATARRQIAAFDAARTRGEDRAEVDGHWVELPTYLAAQRLIARADAFEAI